MSAPRVSDRDKGYRDLLARFRSLKKRPGIAAGILQGKGAETHKDPVHGSKATGKKIKTRQASDEGSVTILDVAIWNEFGTFNEDGSVRIPARSFIRSYADLFSQSVQKDFGKALRLVVAGKWDLKQALTIVGVKVVAGMQLQIAEGIQPANAESTVEQKGSSTPLIDTGQLRSSIAFIVDETGERSKR